MLPSMPILFTRDSQDAFGNRILPSTSFFNQNSIANQAIVPEPPSPAAVQLTDKVVLKETKAKSSGKKKAQENDNTKIDNNVLETALVQSYYTKVQSRFSSHINLPSNKFLQFQDILKSFDPTKETPVDLYRKIEQLFGEDHKDIVEEFLLFLKPGQAAQVGRFMDHFMLVQIKDFIQLLQSTFSRKPTVLRKILRALTTGINTGSSEQMKTRVLPHLRSNPRLSLMFKALFPDERPPDSLYEHGADVISEDFLTGDKGYDVWEFGESKHNMRKLEAKQTLDTMYLHGRVFLQHGRMLRSARVTYPYSKEPYRVHMRRLAHNHSHASPSNTDDERTSPKRQAKVPSKIPPKRTKKQHKSPTKAVKDVNDNTNKDCLTNSPKTVRKPKSRCKDKKEEKSDVLQKKDKKDNKNHVTCKKDDVAKAKQTKGDITPVAPTEESKHEMKASWTRDEDKTMLQVLKGETGSEQIFGRISELLPHRSTTEIKERFCHVMNLLQQMAVGEVT